MELVFVLIVDTAITWTSGRGRSFPKCSKILIPFLSYATTGANDPEHSASYQANKYAIDECASKAMKFEKQTLSENVINKEDAMIHSHANTSIHPLFVPLWTEAERINFNCKHECAWCWKQCSLIL